MSTVDSVENVGNVGNVGSVENVENVENVAARGRLWPREPLMRALFVAVAAACAAYVVATFRIRLPNIFAPWTADGDHAQAVWQYWRYHVEGAIPAGDFLTDYAFVMHAPPVWWALMAGLSTFFEPVFAAKVLHTIAYFLTPAMAFVLVGRRTHFLLGAAAAFLVVRSADYHIIIAGGYARSFGPFLTLLFLWLFMERKHIAVLVVLVLQAAFYPSVVIPCGIAYGLYTVVAGPMPQRVRRMAGMFVAGLLIIAFGKMQDLRAPEWWGPIVSEKEALEMPAWQPGGRINEAPLRPIAVELPRNLERAFRVTGEPWVPDASRALARHTSVAGAVFIGAIAVALVLGQRRTRKRHEAVEPLPWEPLLLMAAAFAAYLLARKMAFTLYLPYRALQHVFPYVIDVAIPLALWAVAVRWLPRFRAAIAGSIVVVVVLSACALWGDGLDRGGATYSNFSWNRKFYRFIRTLPNDAVVGGDFVHTATVPLFGAHQVYINRNLTHPFRKGYYAECERRILRQYRALYAETLDDVVAFGREEKVQYLAYRLGFFKQPDKRLFHPVKAELDRVWREQRPKGFALENPPQKAVVFRNGDQVVVKIDALVP